MSDVVLVEETVDIDAPPHEVFTLLTTVEGLLQWMAVAVECDASPDGTLRWRHEDGSVMSGRFVTIDPPSRLVFTYGWESGGVPGVGPGSTRVEITIVARGSGSRLRVVHSLPSEAAPDHRRGWRWFLGRLAERVGAKSSVIRA